MTRAIVIALVASMVPRLAVADESSEAEQLYNQGQAAFDAKRYDDALAAWHRSFELSREPGLLFNLGQAYRLRAQTGDCARAATAYRKFIAQDPMSSQRQIAEGFASDSEKCAAAEQPVSTTTTTIVQAPIELGGPSRGKAGRTKQIAGITIAGGGVLLVATGLYFGRKASSLGDEVTTACTGGCDWAVYGPKDADGRSAEGKQYIYGGLGVAAIIGGAVLVWLGSHERAASPIAVVSRRDGAGIVWSGSW
jgi:tetratricopeptide (TPR) repeat protein